MLSTTYNSSEGKGEGEGKSREGENDSMHKANCELQKSSSQGRIPLTQLLHM